MSLLTIGSVAFDALETPFGKTDKIIGGAATYITLSASYFTDENNLVAVVGDDFPQAMIDDFNRHGVNTEGLEIRKGEKTFFWSGKYHNDMNTRDTVEVQLNVMENFDPVIPESYQNCQYLMLGNTAPAIQQTVIGRLRNRPKLIVLDTMNLWIETPDCDRLRGAFGGQWRLRCLYPGAPEPRQTPPQTLCGWFCELGATRILICR